MDERDSRQVLRMRQQLDAYQNGSIDLRSLIGDLSFLRDAMSEIDAEWERELNGCVLDLESAFSYSLEKSAGELHPTSKKIVDESLPKLLTLIQQMERG